MRQLTVPAGGFAVHDRHLDWLVDDPAAHPGEDNLVFKHSAAAVTVTRSAGSEALWFTVDGSMPTVGGFRCWCVPAGPAPRSITVPVSTPGPTTVRLWSTSDPTYTVIAT